MTSEGAYTRIGTESELYPNGYRDENIIEEQASLELPGDSVLSERQRRQRWWREALINVLLIASWCVPAYSKD